MKVMNTLASYGTGAITAGQAAIPVLLLAVGGLVARFSKR